MMIREIIAASLNMTPVFKSIEFSTEDYDFILTIGK
jgi:hypothetical protein